MQNSDSSDGDLQKCGWGGCGVRNVGELGGVQGVGLGGRGVAYIFRDIP